MTTPKYHMESIFDPERAHPDDAHSILMRLIPANSRVLELGCATGYLSGYMEQRLGCRVTGLEADAEAVRIASTRCTEAFVTDLDALDALDAASANAPYDVLLAAAVLEHLKYPERLLQQAKSLLKAQGIVIVSLPNIAHWTMRLQHLFGHFNYTQYGIMDQTHLHFYTARTGGKLLQQTGYQITHFAIAGSAVQNLMNAFSRRLKRPQPAPRLAGLLAYELIYVAQQAKSENR